MTTKFDQIWKSIEDDEMRREFNLDVDTGLAFQIKLLREKNGWTQQQLADQVESKQETISQWENPNYGRYTLKTIKSLATAFDVGLMVKFAPFGEVIGWNANLTPERLAPPSFTEEQRARQSGRTLGYWIWTSTRAPTPTVPFVADATVRWADDLLHEMTIRTDEPTVRPTERKEEEVHAYAA